MPHPRRPLVIVPHTHWDREWYRTFERYRYRLVATIDRVLDADMPHFLLDGQTVVVEDYLAVRPERRGRLEDGIRAGKLAIGPWCVLVDEFLVSGEALIRNLLAGRAAMRSLGAVDPTHGVGYLPDMFGHIAQMPQVLAGFGLDRAVVWRGARPASPAFWWYAPDGTRVRAAWLPQGYYQTQLIENLEPEERLKRVEAYADGFGDGDRAWLLAGADHMAPRADTEALVEAIAAASVRWDARITSLDALFEGPAPHAELHGELRETAGMAYLLPGVLSARTYLKQANARAQSLLERGAEPLAALAWWSGEPADRLAAGLGYAWRTLMLNHPHDSICGCSIDEVHREMLPRFEAVEQVAGEVIAEACRVEARPGTAPAAFIFNGSGTSVHEPVTLTFDWAHHEEAPAPDALRLVDGSGRAVAFEVLSVRDEAVFAAEPDLLPDWYPARRFTLVASVDVPALGGTSLHALAAPGWPAPPAWAGLGHDGTGIENDHLRLEVVEGRLDLLDKSSGRRYRDVHAFTDEADAGDSYNFSPLEGDEPLRATIAWHRVDAERPWERILEVGFRLTAPLGLEPDRTARSREAVQVEIVSRFRLTAQARVVAIDTQFEHEWCDHRLKLAVRGVGPDAEAHVEGTFGVFRREAPLPSPLPAARGTEAVMPELPQAGFTALVEGSGHGLAVLGEGLHEVSLLADSEGTGLALTLLRAVGWLSRDDLRTRGGGAGPRFPTPDAQCPGRQTFRHGLAPLTGGWKALLPSAGAFAAPLRVLAGPGPACGAPGITCDVPGLVWSAMKRSEDGTRLVLRAYNASPEAASGTLDLALRPSRVEEGNLAEETLRALPAQGPWQVDLRPWEIRTWLFTP